MDANTAIAIVSILLLVGILISMGIGRLQGEQPPEPVK
jgi:predicted histidine transporter YuiF (NhaC family)